MRGHPKRIAALVLALALLAGLGWVANSLVGNPVSRVLAARTARTYLEETSPAPDYVLEAVRYSFKEGGVSCPSRRPRQRGSAIRPGHRHGGPPSVGQL